MWFYQAVTKLTAPNSTGAPSAFTGKTRLEATRRVLPQARQRRSLRKRVVTDNYGAMNDRRRGY